MLSTALRNLHALAGTVSHSIFTGEESEHMLFNAVPQGCLEMEADFKLSSSVQDRLAFPRC